MFLVFQHIKLDFVLENKIHHYTFVMHGYIFIKQC